MSQQTITTTDYVAAHDADLKKIATYVGRNVDDVLKELGQPSSAELEQAAQSAQAKLDAMVTAGGPASYAGSASLWGFIRGGMNANITFGDSGPFSFSGSMWTSPIAAAGGGAGFWSVIPPNGQEMDFVWTGAALEGGGVALLWSVNGTTLGAMSIFVAGLGIGGGKGSGTWTKG